MGKCKRHTFSYLGMDTLDDFENVGKMIALLYQIWSYNFSISSWVKSVMSTIIPIS